MKKYCKCEEIKDEPTVTNIVSRSLSFAESSLCFKIKQILVSEYFINPNVIFSEISHALPIIVRKDESGINIHLNIDNQTIKTLLHVYDTEYTAFSALVKDFVRTALFPLISNYVPSSTTSGAAAFLQLIKRSRECFEYTYDETDDFLSFWSDYMKSNANLFDSFEKKAQKSVQVVDKKNTADFSNVAPDIIANEKLLQEDKAQDNNFLGPLPSILRQDINSKAKLLTIAPENEALRGYRCFLALTDRIRKEFGEFFLQPHTTAVIWGGQKILFIFINHSKEYGIYYDLLTNESSSSSAGGGEYITSSIIMKNNIYIPIPSEIQDIFLPKDDSKKKFEVRADLISTDLGKQDTI